MHDVVILVKNLELPKLTCEKCGHVWIPRVEKPVKCSKCGHILGTRVYANKGKKVERNG
jgi:predicted Zn-ribbon and HTH transcriptional regulator